ncbi:G-type lectin S-receptor-like serine/threonine-protein kinase LECRK4 [Gossypium hirsutum]|uniref:G-type lectin S-receptor-like serine/threonine-protein kinase LECRK4 n=1 Tax=Gossypium hirsutum TaxID=3635 RepID=A0A1U8M8R7_GOSHI|nr:G-type lectin S-receptor-like serine/threonine-protein kinase LECRK4 [Gossypium hirsutum]
MLNGLTKVVAVKRLDNISNQGEREFQNEMRIIGRTHHQNLVRLLGYCHDGANRLLIYEYMINGSLSDVLFTPERRPCWIDRVEIARDVARGLLYLHEECDTQIIHCDIKSQNILMDENRQAKISVGRERDFAVLVEKAMIAEEVKRAEKQNREKDRNRFRRDSGPSGGANRIIKRAKVEKLV